MDSLWPSLAMTPQLPPASADLVERYFGNAALSKRQNA